jgi:hypothetical protein
VPQAAGDTAGPVGDIVPKALLRPDDIGPVATSVIARSINMHSTLLADAIDEVVNTHIAASPLHKLARRRGEPARWRQRQRGTRLVEHYGAEPF